MGLLLHQTPLPGLSRSHTFGRLATPLLATPLRDDLLTLHPPIPITQSGPQTSSLAWAAKTSAPDTADSGPE